MAVSFLQSLRGRQSRGANFGFGASSDGGVSAPAPAAVPSSASASVPDLRQTDGDGSETGGYAGYGTSASLGDFLGSLATGAGMVAGGPVGALLGGALTAGSMISNPSRTNVVGGIGDLTSGKPTSTPNMISDYLGLSSGPTADPGKAAAAAGAGGAMDGGAKGADTGDVGGKDGGQGPAGGETEAGSGQSPGGQDGGQKARTGAFLGDSGPPGELNERPITAHDNEFILRPEVTMAIGPELLTAMNAGVVPPDVMREVLMGLIEDYAPGYLSEDPPIAGPNGTMMPSSEMGGGMLGMEMGGMSPMGGTGYGGGERIMQGIDSVTAPPAQIGGGGSQGFGGPDMDVGVQHAFTPTPNENMRLSPTPEPQGWDPSAREAQKMVPGGGMAFRQGGLVRGEDGVMRPGAKAGMGQSPDRSSETERSSQQFRSGGMAYRRGGLVPQQFRTMDRAGMDPLATGMRERLDRADSNDGATRTPVYSGGPQTAPMPQDLPNLGKFMDMDDGRIPVSARRSVLRGR